MLNWTTAPQSIRWKTAVLAAALAMILALAAVACGSAEQPAAVGQQATETPAATGSASAETQAATEEPAPAAMLAHAFELPTAAGETVSLASFAGDKNVVVVFYRGFW